MSEQEKQLRLEGIVHGRRARRYVPGGRGKLFLGAAIESSDGKVWVIDYNEESPFHAFAGRHVVVSGESFKPEPGSAHLIGWRGGKELGHFRVSNMRLVEVTPDAELVGVGAGQHLCGRFERGTSETGQSMLSFVTENGDAFLVANDPAGATIGPSVEVWAYPVQRSPSIPKPPQQYVWVICPCSAEDLWKWRERRS